MLSVLDLMFQELLHGSLRGLCSLDPLFMFDNCSFKLSFCGGSLRNPGSQMEARVLVIREFIHVLNSSCRNTVGERQYL
eukprot:7231998-Heterocapsa_arctica.AAC.1